MENVAFLYDDKSQAGTYSGGAWDTGLALANLKTYDPKEVARSDDEQEASTTFVVDLGYAAQIEGACIINHNMTDAAEARVRIGPNADGSDALIDETLTVGNFGSDTPAAGKALFHIADDTVYARYVLWEFSDEYNPAGYVQVGRHIVGPVFQPAVNMVYGAQLSIVDESRISRAVDGSQYVDIQPKRRRMSGAFDVLTEAEAFGRVYDMQKLCGLRIPLFAIRDASLTGAYLQRTSIYGMMTDLQAIQITRVSGDAPVSSWQFTIDERG